MQSFKGIKSGTLFHSGEFHLNKKNLMVKLKITIVYE